MGRILVYLVGLVGTFSQEWKQEGSSEGVGRGSLRASRMLPLTRLCPSNAQGLSPLPGFCRETT